MRFRSLVGKTLFTFLTVSSLFSAQSLAKDATQAAETVFDCRTAFLASLKDRDPDGFKIWNSLSDVVKNHFDRYFKCEPDGQVSGTDANILVHESIHYLDAEQTHKIRTWAYLRPDGTWVNFTQDPKDWLYENSRGQALKVMSQDERKLSRSYDYLNKLGYETFGDLLEELNAYTHGLKTSLRYPKVLGSDLRDGPMELVVFSVRYLEAMKTYSPDYYRSLISKQDLMTTVKSLFEDAYSAYNQSCERTDLSKDDMRSIRALQTDSAQSVMKTVFGDRAPSLSSRCIETAKSAQINVITPVDYPRHE